MAAFAMALFTPTPRQTNFLVLLVCASLGYGLYLRLSVLESLELAAACAAGLPRAVCSLRRIVIDLQDLQFFAGTALAGALYHFFRPALPAFAIALAATAFGLTVGHVGASALAAALLVIGLARPARAGNSTPAPAGSPQTTGPASSRPTH
jgi:hypothetical protein